MALFEQMVAVLTILGIAAVVRAVSTALETVAYPVLLVLVGVGVSLLGVEPAFALTPEFVLSVLIPTILFQGAEETKSADFRANVGVTLVLTVVGLPLAVAVFSVLARVALGLPLVVLLVFAAIVYPIDPVAVIAMFRETGASDRLAVIAENESHLGDGFSIVLYGAFLGVLERQAATGEPLSGIVGPPELAALAVEVLRVTAGGAIVGLALGALVYGLLSLVDERMTELLLLILLPYTSYLAAEHYLHVSGVVATVAAGLLVGIYAKADAIHPDNVAFVERTWATAGFLVGTLLFFLIGVETPVRRILDNAGLVAVTTLLVVASRALAVYALLAVVNRAVSGREIPLRGQHILVWGGMHTVVPVALLFTLPDVPYRRTIGTMVLGVAVVTIVVQGLVLPWVLRVTGTLE